MLAHGLGILVADLGWPLISGWPSSGWPSYGWPSYGLALASALGAAALGGRLGGVRGLALVLAFGAGAASLFARLDSAARFAPRESRELTLEARVCGLERTTATYAIELCGSLEVPSPGRVGVQAVVRPLPHRLLGQFRSSAPVADALGGLRRGDRLRARVRMGPLGGLRNPGRPDPVQRWRRRGVGGRVRFLDPGLVVVLRSGLVPGQGVAPWEELQAQVEAARLGISQGLGDGESGALLAALAVGDRSGLSLRTRDEFARLGIAHVLAISGLHLALAAGSLFAFSRFAFGWIAGPARDVRIAALVLAGVGATGYALLAGFGTPVQRALVFVWANLGALALGRRIPVDHLLALAWLVIGVPAPHELFALGTQLSFSATAALLLAQRNLAPQWVGESSVLGSGLRRARGLVHLSALALLATAPWLAGRGLSTGGAGLVLNLIAIPWTSFLLLPGALLAAVGVGLDPVTGGWILKAAHFISSLTLGAVHELVQAIPGGPGLPGRPAALALGVAAGLAGLASRQTETRKVVVLALVSLIWLSEPIPGEQGPPPPRFVMFDVGQGDALLVQGEHSAVLVDAGRAIPGEFDLGRSVVVPALVALGVEALDVLVATHSDIDHRGGVPAVLEAMPVAELWLPWQGRSDPGFGPSLEVARRKGVRIVETGASGPDRSFGGLKVTPLWPPRAHREASANARSLVLLFQLAGTRLLLTGDIGIDIEHELQRSGVDLQADLLKVAHHGSDGSSSADFLRAVRPSWLMLSAPCGGGARLPHPRALERLFASGAGLGWTGRDGALAVALTAQGGPRIVALTPPGGAARTCADFPGGVASAWREPGRNP